MDLPQLAKGDAATEGDGLMLPASDSKAAPEARPSRQQIGRAPRTRSRIQAAGSINAAVLAVGLAVSTAVAAYLIFLWLPLLVGDSHLGPQLTGLWNSVALASWIPASVTISSAALRAVLGMQFATAVSLAAAVLLEGRGVPVRFAPLALTLRTSSMPSTWRLLDYLGGTLALDVPTTLATAVLVATTLLSQLSSTLLVSDLGTGPILSSLRAEAVGYGFSNPPNLQDGQLDFERFQEATNDASYWQAGSSEYPLFAEASETPLAPESLMLDTGPSLRAFPPLGDGISRASLHSYGGYAPVFDARVSCMTPLINANFTVEDDVLSIWTSAQFNGRLWVDIPSRARWHLDGADQSVREMWKRFNCSISLPADAFEGQAVGEWALTICEPESGAISLESPINDGSDGEGISPRFLIVVNATGRGVEWKRAVESGSFGWTVSNQTVPWTRLAHPSRRLFLDVSFCLDTFQDTINVPVSMTRPGRPRPEPLLQWDQGRRRYDASNITRLHAGAVDGLSYADRNVLILQQRANWTEDMVRTRRFLVPATSISTFQGLWAMYDSDISVTLCTFCENSETSFRAHRHHVTVFQAVLLTTGSLPLAIQALWTILTQRAYYDFIAEYDVAAPAEYSLFADRVIPIRQRGLLAVLAILVAHNVALLLLVGRFLSRPRLAMPGQLWQAFGQLAASGPMLAKDDGSEDEDDECVAGWALRATTARDSEVEEEMRRRNGAGGVGGRGEVALVYEHDDFGSGQLHLRPRTPKLAQQGRE
ncbi:hypothetical protein B0T14DRAFT_563615 [Immersiella caudata]|uniref:Uncharacterized protein n=1 Tax=Immersiella caudata TaxID=314043 RepID=A0AA40C7H6_9PEZI|nr:hypothetical protein B0T14DRAFT_563615 [Immersiella caudata]